MLTNDARVDNIILRDKTDLGDLLFGELDQVGILAIPEAVAFKAKIFETEAAHACRYHFR